MTLSRVCYFLSVVTHRQPITFSVDSPCRGGRAYGCQICESGAAQLSSPHGDPFARGMVLAHPCLVFVLLLLLQPNRVFQTRLPPRALMAASSTLHPSLQGVLLGLEPLFFFCVLSKTVLELAPNLKGIAAYLNIFAALTLLCIMQNSRGLPPRAFPGGIPCPAKSRDFWLAGNNYI